MIPPVHVVKRLIDGDVEDISDALDNLPKPQTLLFYCSMSAYGGVCPGSRRR